MSAVTLDDRGVGVRAAVADPSNWNRIRTLDRIGLIITIVTVLAAIFWAFPIYWALVTTFKPEQDVVRPGIELWPQRFTFEAYTFTLFNTKIGLWYVNSIVTSLAVTFLVVTMSAAAGYAISQLEFPGRRLLWWMILASFMVPIPALIVNHFVLMSQFKLINTWLGVILPQLIAPVTVMIYKQFFDSVPKDFREAAVIDGASELQLLFRLYLPMNWGITTALAIIAFIGAWNQFLWPFLVTTSEDMMNVTVGITQVTDAFGVKYARQLATAILAGLPVALIYLIFQRKVTQAIMLTAGIKG
jgi:multiple sugar transport system permease protein